MACGTCWGDGAGDAELRREGFYRMVRILAAMQHENLMRFVDLPPVPDGDFEDVYIVLPYMHTEPGTVVCSLDQYPADAGPQDVI